MHKSLYGPIAIALLLTGCSTSKLQPEPPQAVTGDPVVYFELDTTNHTIRPVNATAQGVAKQALYRAGTGFTFTEAIKEQVGGVYTVEFTLTNATQQDMGVDDHIQATFVNFQARDASSASVAGGGVVNASGYQAQTFYPYISISNQKNLLGTNPLPIEPGTSFKFQVSIQVPPAATKAIVGLMVQASQVHNNIPTSTFGMVTPAYGLYGASGFGSGTSEKVRFTKPQHFVVCPDEPGTTYMVDQNALWKLKNNQATVRMFPNNQGLPYSLGNVSGLVCTEAGFFFTSSNMVSLQTLDGNVKHVVGDVQPGLSDGTAYGARFDSPTEIISYGPRLYVLDWRNRRIRAIHQSDTQGDYHTTTRYVHPTSVNIESIAVDEKENLYFTTYNFDTPGDLWRLPAGSSTAVKIATGTIGWARDLFWHPSGYLLVAERNANRVSAYYPSSPDHNLPWNRVIVAGNTNEQPPVPYGTGPNVPVSKPEAVTVDAYGNVLVASYDYHFIYRVDRLR